jgi:hypothetical protein
MSVVEGRADIKDLPLEIYFNRNCASSDLRGGGWSILWREEDADRWAWFIPKIFDFFTRKSPLAASVNVRCGWKSGP